MKIKPDKVVKLFNDDGEYDPHDVEPTEEDCITINVVPDEACPECGAIWGHSDPDLDFPNRPKVGQEDGWWWKCCNPKCKVSYYNPENGGIEY